MPVLHSYRRGIVTQLAAIMTAVNRFAFLATAMIFHLVYLFSIFDIYFVSPVVSGVRLFAIERVVPAKPPADRLVLFVGAETLAPLDMSLDSSLCF